MPDDAVPPHGPSAKVEALHRAILANRTSEYLSPGDVQGQLSENRAKLANISRKGKARLRQPGQISTGVYDVKRVATGRHPRAHAGDTSLNRHLVEPHSPGRTTYSLLEKPSTRGGVGRTPTIHDANN